MRPFAQLQSLGDRNAPRLQAANLLQHRLRMKDHSRGDHIDHRGVDDSAGDQMQFVDLVTHHDRMTGIGPALVANHDIKLAGQQIHQLAFGLVAPLQTDHTQIWHIFTHGHCRALAR